MRIRRITSILLSLLMLLCVLTVPASVATADDENVKNVIYMIGDGMGENHLLLAREQGYDLFMDTTYDLRGQQRTRSFSSAVTDSAAGATALSCGVRTTNRYLGVYAFDPFGVFVQARSITENAIRRGMRTGIVTTDGTTGATPAGFSVHVQDRGKGEKITKQQLNSDIDLIWGAACEEVQEADVKAKGWTYVTTKDEMNALTPGERSFAQFSWDTWRLNVPEGDASPTLAEMTVKALELLDYNNERGFFIMIEGAHIDKNSHRTEEGEHFDAKVKDAAEAVKGFDNAIRAAVEFARQDGNTIVVVTADHETGDLYPENGVYTFHSGSHTGKNVPVLVWGCDDLIAPGSVIDNKDIPALLAERLGWESEELPHADAGLMFGWMRKLFRS